MAKSRSGFVKKKIAVRRGGRTFYQTRSVAISKPLFSQKTKVAVKKAAVTAGQFGAELAGLFARSVVSHAGEHVGSAIGDHIVNTTAKAYKARFNPPRTRRRK